MTPTERVLLAKLNAQECLLHHILRTLMRHTDDPLPAARNFSAGLQDALRTAPLLPRATEGVSKLTAVERDDLAAEMAQNVDAIMQRVIRSLEKDARRPRTTAPV